MSPLRPHRPLAFFLTFTGLAVFGAAVLGATQATAVEPGADAKPPTAKEKVDLAVIQPMQAAFARRAMFSRAQSIPPKLLIDVAKAAQVDRHGESFITFTIRREGDKAELLAGCVYDDGVYLKEVKAKGGPTFVPSHTHPELAASGFPSIEGIKPLQAPPASKVRPGACQAQAVTS